MPWDILQHILSELRIVNGVKNENNSLAMKKEYTLNDPIEILLKQKKMCIFSVAANLPYIVQQLMNQGKTHNTHIGI